MSFVVNSNQAATKANLSLVHAQTRLGSAMNKLSSGTKILSGADDSGGLAVGMKLESTNNLNQSVIENLQNALSYLQLQDEAMDKMSEIVDRVGQLRVLASDITKNDSDILNYSKEFLELQGKMDNAAETKLNGVDLFVFQQQSLSSKIKSVPATHTNEDGSIENYLKYSLNLETEDISGTVDTSINVSVVNMLFILTPTTTVIDEKLTSYSQSMIDETAKRLLSARADNGAQQKRIQLEIENLRSESSDLELAKSRIMDADIARESTTTIKEKVIMEASSSMFTQANKLQTETALKLMT
ncbi:MAG: hypothetical protein CMI23_11705 [Opitutae bacterium]|nr:hypothetical protein [Opitutae bacterium]